MPEPAETVTPASAAPRIAAPRVAASADPRLDTWRAFLHAHARVTRRLDDELQAAHGLSLAEYDALLQLARSPGRRLRMNLLADRVLLSRSGITRLVDRLVTDGSVERATCSTDARGAEAVLTRHGVERLRTASTTHLEGIGRYFLDVVEPAELDAIEQGLGRVATRLGPDCGPGPQTADD
ncbi:MAG: MarR family winged helix-turn-helix transcriptional regulator [Chloroflexota bacterium]